MFYLCVFIRYLFHIYIDVNEVMLSVFADGRVIWPTNGRTITGPVNNAAGCEFLSERT